MKPTDRRPNKEQIESVLNELVQKGLAVESAVPDGKGQRLFRHPVYKEFKSTLQLREQQYRQLDDPFISAQLTEALAHCGGESGVWRTVRDLEDALSVIQEDIKSDQ